MRSWGWFGMGVLVLFAADSARDTASRGEPLPAEAPQPMVIVEFVPARRPLNEQIPVASRTAPKTKGAAPAAKADDDDDDDDDADDADDADADTADDDTADDDNALEEDLGGHAGPPSERDISSRLGRMRVVLKRTKPAGGASALTDEPDEKQTKGADDELRAIGQFSAGNKAEKEKKGKDGKNGSTLAEHESDGALPSAATRHRPLTKFQRQ